MAKQMEQEVSNREVKSSAFTTYFSIPENAAQLFSSLKDIDISPEDIEFTTLDGVLFLARKNDLAFKAGNKFLVISEHQSTICLNMPLRCAIYYGRTMEKLINPQAIYRRKLIPIPTPEFYVFYNGNDAFPAEKILELSDAYLEKTPEPMLNLKVKVININLPKGHILLSKCRPLYEYSWFIQRIKDYIARGVFRDEAITQAVLDCQREGILADFVREHGSEAVNMLFTQFNMEDALDANYKEGFEDGELKGELKGELLKLIQLTSRKLQKGKSPETIAEELEEDSVLISQICTAIQQCGTDADETRIYDSLQTVDA